MKCEICGRGMPEGASFFRINPKGEIGKWHCELCYKGEIDEISRIIMEANKPPANPNPANEVREKKE